ncbi:MAG: FAD-dependent oxidoreductase [Spirochaetaceae bacterium]|nr:FAD-dependent oxidoreductase [Spirochaetaceae bacterium]
MAGGERFDLCVYGATPAGIACAVRAAREGLKVALVHHHAHIGGMWTNGLGVLDTVYDGPRAPLYDEMVARMCELTRRESGADSEAYRRTQWDPPEVSSRHPYFAPHVAEAVLDSLVDETAGLSLYRERAPRRVSRAGRLLLGVTFEGSGGAGEIEAATFADASYEGDLYAAAGARFRVGRESRRELNEIHAGRIFSILRRDSARDGYPRAIRRGELRLRTYGAITGEICAGSTGEGDAAIQAYNVRLCLTNDPQQRRLPAKPAWYRRELFHKLRDRWTVSGGVRVHKVSWNAANLPEGGWRYPLASWEERRRITERHRDWALGLLHFLQNDADVPDELRRRARQWGLAADEFPDNDNVPYEMYVREARRLVGRYLFTEHDSTLAPGLERAPIHADSIGVTEWALDSHECHWDTVGGSSREGKILMTELTRPGQVPYRCLLPREIDNLLVPGCCSASHVGWGTIRVEPTMVPIGEAAGIAAAQAGADGVPVADVDIGAVQRALVESGAMLTFLNDGNPGDGDAVPALQMLGVHGFFGSYDARPAEPLDRAEAALWAGGLADVRAGVNVPDELARRILNCAPAGRGVTRGEWNELLRVRGMPPERDGPESATPLTRAGAAGLAYRVLAR